MYHPIREGTRGGQGLFTWAQVGADKDREHYLGHSINAPTGRWQKNQDVHWYNRDKQQEDEDRAEEIRRVKEAEEEAISIALGFTPNPKNPDAPASIAATPSTNPNPNMIPIEGDPSANASGDIVKGKGSDSERKEDKEERRARKEARRVEREGRKDHREKERKERPHHRRYSHHDHSGRDYTRDYDRNYRRDYDHDYGRRDHYDARERDHYRSSERTGRPSQDVLVDERRFSRHDDRIPGEKDSSEPAKHHRHRSPLHTKYTRLDEGFGGTAAHNHRRHSRSKSPSNYQGHGGRKSESPASRYRRSASPPQRPRSSYYRKDR